MTLLVDADDTLWENIVVFHRINARYAQWIAPDRDPVDVRAELDELQISLIGQYGYGRLTFERSLLAGIERFAQRSPTPDDEALVADFVAPLRWDSLEVIDGVEDTLAALADHRPLIMVTKGNHDEQRHKIDRSGLGHFFDAVEILHDKTVDEYERIASSYSLDRDNTWMIGNSPRSDIRPALQAGLGAIFIPHAETWSHERDELPEHPRLHQLPDFTSLVEFVTGP